MVCSQTASASASTTAPSASWVPRTHTAECSRQPQRAKERKCCFCGAGESCKLLKLDSRKLLVADSEGACYQEQLEEKLKRRRENATLWSEPFLALSPVLKAVNSPQRQICASHTHRCSRDYCKTVSVSLCKWNIYIYIYFLFPSRPKQPKKVGPIFSMCTFVSTRANGPTVSKAHLPRFGTSIQMFEAIMKI